MCVVSVWHIGWCAKILTPPMKKENVLRMFYDLSTNTSLAKRDVGSSWNKTSSSAAIINANLKKKHLHFFTDNIRMYSLTICVTGDIEKKHL